ncbi:methyl-accepting chemotaxis protein McpA [Brachyspira intermedia PWS/A]|uniref:Methyl-accepting chemotaxis protein McpA n=1 Tax=Brachyspira intermedia (strain ATCC 51140 / PWS/A) TaxID=1045858 RepID=G0EHT4_BRAIP|nr:methyl-accepting chemotaxis protein [Brachyspira intermedia]AEM20897.1 methyl-accepting chemotaxis protein McpA [Brachyspira intermedia PWS/A]
MKRIHSLSFKVPAIISVISILIIFIILSIAVMFANKGISKSRFEGFANTAQSYAKLFDAILIDQVSLAKTYSVAPAIMNSLLNRNEQTEAVALNALALFNGANEYSINIAVIDLNGDIIADALGNSIGNNIADTRPNFWNILESKNFEYTFDEEIIDSVDTGNKSLILGGAIKSLDGNLLGAILVVIDWKLIHDNYFSDIALGETGRILAIDSNLIDIMDNIYEQIGSNVVQDYKTVFDNNLNQGTLSYIYMDKKRTGSYCRMKSMNWIIAMTMFDSEIYATNRELILISSLVGLIAILLLSIFVALFIKRIMGHINSIIREAKEIETGNLTYVSNEHKRKDELGILFESFSGMRKKLTEIISQVNDSSIKITTAAQELANGNSDLSRRTEAQAASLEETASSMEEMASTIKSSTSHSIEGNNMMKESMSSIKDAGAIILETTKSIEEVNEDSEKIKNITKVIEDIAFQTNILALNAAVEAARAGDQGKGFAVVASEVRNLAQNSQSSAKDITTLINVIYDKISKSVEKAKESEKIFEDLEKKIEETSNIMRDISETAIEQQAGVDQVNTAVSQMDSVTQQNAGLVEQSASAAASLLNEARELEEAMRFFKLDK